MKHAFIDEHSHMDSLIHRLDPRVKVVSFSLFVVLIVLTGPASWRAYALYGLLLLGLVSLSRISPAYIIRRSLVIIPFVFMIALFIPFIRPGEAVGAFSLGFLKLTVTHEGLIIFASLLVKAWLSILCMILLTSATPFPDLLKALEKMRFPALMAMVLSFMYRYVFVIEDEFMKMRQARASRSTGCSRWLDWQVTANMIGVLFIRAYERAEAVYLAMCSRGFTGRIYTSHSFQLARRDLVFLTAMAVFLAAIQWAVR